MTLTIGAVIAIFLTFCIFSFLYGDNPFYKLAEHIFLGVSAGYYLVIQWTTTVQQKLVSPLWAPIGGDAPFTAEWIGLLVPLLLCALMCMGFFASLSPALKRHAWVATISYAFTIGSFAGISITGSAQGDLVEQMNASMVPLVAHSATGGVDWFTSFNNVVLVVGLLACLLYFFYSKPQVGALKVVSRVGIYFLMVSFGASFGYTVMTRIALAVGRAQEALMFPWTTLASMVLIVATLAFLHFSRRTASS